MNTKHQALVCKDKAALQQLVYQAFAENPTGVIVTSSLSLLSECLSFWSNACNDVGHVSCTGGYIVMSHPLGRRWLNETLHSKDPVMVPHLLPDQAQLEALIADLPLQIHSYLEEDQLYIATLQVNIQSWCGITHSCWGMPFCLMFLLYLSNSEAWTVFRP